MARKTRVVGFSIPPEIDNKLERFIKSKHKTRSEFIREMIDVYFNSINTKSEAPSEPKMELTEGDLAKVLKSYWLLRSQAPLKVITIGLAIIVNKDNNVLIGARKAKDKWVDNLTWVFPGGNLDSLDFSKDVQSEVKQETGLEVKVNSLVASRIHPDSGFKSLQINALYFYCSPISDKKLRPGGDLKSLKWVEPTDVFKYFTTSTCDEVTKFLTTLEKAS
jgi:ADP-ribose pyrophosphatase YjhB (NUDIX family)/predicted DNA-binding protein